MKTILVDAVNCFVSKDGQIFEAMRNLLETYPNRKIILTGANNGQKKETSKGIPWTEKHPRDALGKGFHLLYYSLCPSKQPNFS